MRKNKEEIKEFNKKILAVCDFLIENGYERSAAMKPYMAVVDDLKKKEMDKFNKLFL